MRIPLCNLHLPSASIQEAEAALADGWISGTGPAITRFEALLAQKVKRRYAVAVTNGTHALEVALQALGVHQGDEVIVPALTFVSPAAAARQVGATPVFADVDENTWTINPFFLPITRHTQAIIGVDLLGHPVYWEHLEHIGREHAIDIIEDAAEAHGALYRGKPVGSFGFVSTFSFHANKTITTGEGGAVVLDGAYFNEQVRLIANHGMKPDKRYWHEVVGSNYRMNNVTAAIGVGQMANWDQQVAARNKVAECYDIELGDLLKQGDLRRRPVADFATEAVMLYTLTHPNRDKIVERLQKNGIDARPLWTALVDLPIYRDGVRGNYPVARRLAAEGFLLPTWAGMPYETIAEVANAVREAVTERMPVCSTSTPSA